MVSLQELKHTIPRKALKEMEKAERAQVANRTEEPITRCKQAISIDPEYVAAHHNLAIVYLNGSNTQQALAELEEAIKVEPHNPTLFTNLSIGYFPARQLADAERTARCACLSDEIIDTIGHSDMFTQQQE
jgi:predicted Zn-dependent protease